MKLKTGLALLIAATVTTTLIFPEPAHAGLLGLLKGAAKSGAKKPKPKSGAKPGSSTKPGKPAKLPPKRSQSRGHTTADAAANAPKDTAARALAHSRAKKVPAGSTSRASQHKAATGSAAKAGTSKAAARTPQVAKSSGRSATGSKSAPTSATKTKATGNKASTSKSAASRDKGKAPATQIISRSPSPSRGVTFRSDKTGVATAKTKGASAARPKANVASSSTSSKKAGSSSKRPAAATPVASTKASSASARPAKASAAKKPAKAKQASSRARPVAGPSKAKPGASTKKRVQKPRNDLAAASPGRSGKSTTQASAKGKGKKGVAANAREKVGKLDTPTVAAGAMMLAPASTGPAPTPGPRQ